MMTSPEKLQANRRNALMSTGPRTAEGKAIVSRNAIRHGLLSRHVLLPDDDPAELDALQDRLYGQLQPVGDLEELLVDQIVASAWRLRRCMIVELGVFAEKRSREYPAPTDVSPGVAFSYGGNGRDVFTRLCRYERAIEASLYRALHELQRLQADRAGDAVPLPAVADVDVTLSDTGPGGFAS